MFVHAAKTFPKTNTQSCRVYFFCLLHYAFKSSKIRIRLVCIFYFDYFLLLSFISFIFSNSCCFSIILTFTFVLDLFFLAPIPYALLLHVFSFSPLLFSYSLPFPPFFFSYLFLFFPFFHYDFSFLLSSSSFCCISVSIVKLIRSIIETFRVDTWFSSNGVVDSDFLCLFLDNLLRGLSIHSYLMVWFVVTTATKCCALDSVLGEYSGQRLK